MFRKPGLTLTEVLKKSGNLVEIKMAAAEFTRSLQVDPPLSEQNLLDTQAGSVRFKVRFD